MQTQYICHLAASEVIFNQFHTSYDLPEMVKNCHFLTKNRWNFSNASFSLFLKFLMLPNASMVFYDVVFIIHVTCLTVVAYLFCFLSSVKLALFAIFRQIVPNSWTTFLTVYIFGDRKGVCFRICHGLNFIILQFHDVICSLKVCVAVVEF